MRKIFFTGLVVVIFLFQSFAQKGESIKGLFMSAEDFSEGKLSFAQNSNSKGNKILLNDLFNKKYITVKQNDSSYRFLKSSIYGFEEYDGDIYRFLGKKELFLLNKEDTILIYKWILPRKPADARINATNYYFSIGKEGVLKKLTIKNLKNAFITNTKFQVLIDRNFKYNTDLAEFDKVNKLYKINYLLKESGL
jgi:hypothetical protein